jgi:hypothetical protein
VVWLDLLRYCLRVGGVPGGALLPVNDTCNKFIVVCGSSV